MGCPSVDLSVIQQEIKDWSTHNFGRAEKDSHIFKLLGVVEEVGELAHALLKSKQGIRGSKEKHLADAKDAVGDILIFLADFCNHYELSLNDCVHDAWSQVSRRDWTKEREILPPSLCRGCGLLTVSAGGSCQSCLAKPSRDPYEMPLPPPRERRTLICFSCGLDFPAGTLLRLTSRGICKKCSEGTD